MQTTCYTPLRQFTATVIFEPAEEGGFIATVPSLTECYTQGETFEETKENIEEVITEYLLALKERGEELPRSDQYPIITTIHITLPA